MSKNYDRVWQLIESLDDISAELSDLLDSEKDRHAIPHMEAAIEHIESAVSELENVDPEKEDGGSDYPTGTILIGKIL